MIFRRSTSESLVFHIPRRSLYIYGYKDACLIGSGPLRYEFTHEIGTEVFFPNHSSEFAVKDRRVSLLFRTAMNTKQI